MQWTKVRTTRLGTSLQKRGRWHGLPFVIRGFDVRSIKPRGWVVVALAALLLVAMIILEELIP
jgi:hypothetical protein